jgi:hypothetical protein
MTGVLRHVFEALRVRRGEWTLFAVLYRGRRELEPWDIMVAAPWITDSQRLQATGEILGVLREVATPKELNDLGMVVRLTSPDQVATAARELLNGRSIDHPVGLVRRKNFVFSGQSLRRAYIWAVNLPEPTAAATPAA